MVKEKELTAFNQGDFDSLVGFFSNHDDYRVLHTDEGVLVLELQNGYTISTLSIRSPRLVQNVPPGDYVATKEGPADFGCACTEDCHVQCLFRAAEDMVRESKAYLEID